MATLSLCMIVKNEEDTLARCLMSVRAAMDEIVVVDTGSTDKTREIAKKAGAKVYEFEWIDDFAAARNHAFSLAKCDYIMWLDADDILTEENLSALLALKARLDGRIRQVAARYDVAFDENGTPTFSYYRERIFLRSAGFLWRGAVHETIALELDAVTADFAVWHKKMHPTEQGRNLRIFEKLRQSGAVFSSRELYYYARELYYNDRTEAAERTFEQFLARDDGFNEDKIGACLLLARCKNRLSNPLGALRSLFYSFVYGAPRAEICCEIGSLFLDQKALESASYWYKLALRDVPEGKDGGFVHRDCCNFVPLLSLCVCYDRMGFYDMAEAYNEQAALIKPENDAVLKNKLYFDALKNKAVASKTV